MNWLETFAYLAIATVLAHGLGEWRGSLASWSIHYQYQRGAFAPWQAPRWLELGLPIFATTWNGATIAAGLAWPAYQSALWSIAAGGMLADALAIHIAGRWAYGRWPPGSITVPVYLVAGGAWAWHHPSYWMVLGALPFLPYWWLVALYNRVDELLDETAKAVVKEVGR